ncbi:VWA domain-containing protein [Halomicroarcula sp. GCM10025709]|uniref:vWA domain-containing protein n=1 Tax=Halomicroarcula sp. GCM10025709 TaxID=3252669 RepID=UPI00361CE2D8
MAEPRPLGGNRPYLEDRIRRLQTTGSTRIASGLDGGSEMLGDGGGTVILLSDGRDKRGGAVAAATELGNQGTEVVAIGVGSQRNESLLRQIADASDGTYLQADQTSRLRLRYGAPTGGSAVRGSPSSTGATSSPTAWSSPRRRARPTRSRSKTAVTSWSRAATDGPRSRPGTTAWAGSSRSRPTAPTGPSAGCSAGRTRWRRRSRSTGRSATPSGWRPA